MLCSQSKSVFDTSEVVSWGHDSGVHAGLLCILCFCDLPWWTSPVCKQVAWVRCPVLTLLSQPC